MIAGSFGVSAGLEQSGGAAAIANLIVSIGAPLAELAASSGLTSARSMRAAT